MSNKMNVRDPVHNYIYMTDVEENVIQHPLFQRLRHISQNGAAYFTYPSNKHDRFLHSLGVMKIGGDIFLNATEDLDDPEVKQFLAAAYGLIRREARELNLTIETAVEAYIAGSNKTFQKYGLLIHEASVVKELKSYLADADSIIAVKFTRTLIFQSLRLACLLHDIGHFPYSHTVEYAIGDYIARLQDLQEEGIPITAGEQVFLKDYAAFKKHLQIETVDMAIHEMIGVKMLDEILPAQDLNGFQSLARRVAKQILARQSSNPVYGLLHALVSGELDADRLDYSLRDPYTSGLELGQIDLERLLNHFTIVTEAQEQGHDFRILPKVQALSVIETFYHNRYLSYKYLIYHHSKVRMDTILGQIAYRLLYIHFNRSEATRWIEEILDQDQFSFLWSKMNDRISPSNRGDGDYYYCDEGWFHTLIKKIYYGGNGNLERTAHTQTQQLLLLIETFIFRRTQNIVSLFKRYDTYFAFFAKVKEAVAPFLPVPDEKEFIKECVALIFDGVLEEFARNTLEKHQVLVLSKMTPPKTIEFDQAGNSKLKIVVAEESKRVLPLQKVSPYLESLRYMNDSDQLFHLFLVGEQIKKRNLAADIEYELCTFLKEQFLEENGNGKREKPGH